MYKLVLSDKFGRRVYPGFLSSALPHARRTVVRSLKGGVGYQKWRWKGVRGASFNRWPIMIAKTMEQITPCLRVGYDVRRL